MLLHPSPPYPISWIYAPFEGYLAYPLPRPPPEGPTRWVVANSQTHVAEHLITPRALWCLLRVNKCRTRVPLRSPTILAEIEQGISPRYGQVSFKVPPPETVAHILPLRFKCRDKNKGWLSQTMGQPHIKIRGLIKNYSLLNKLSRWSCQRVSTFSATSGEIITPALPFDHVISGMASVRTSVFRILSDVGLMTDSHSIFM